MNRRLSPLARFRPWLIGLFAVAVLAGAYLAFPLRAAPPTDAAAIARECRSDLHCVYTRLAQVVERVGTREAMTLATALTSQPGYADQGHPFAHEVGYATYRRYPTLAQRLTACTDQLGSGCLHGVMMLFISDGQNAGVNLSEACLPFKGQEPHALYTDCVHGIGHGVMMREITAAPGVAGWPELERALAVCREMRQLDGSEAWFCAGGVFMEYRVAATIKNFHYPVQPKYRADRPHWPCSEVSGVEAQACYAYQGSLIAQNAPSLARAFEICAQAKEPGMAALCASNIGRDRVTGKLELDAQTIPGICTQAADLSLRQACFVDTAQYYVYLDRNLPGALRMCELPGVPQRQACEQAVRSLAAREFGVKG